MSSRKTMNLILLMIVAMVVGVVSYIYLNVYQPLVDGNQKIESSITDVKNQISTLASTKEVNTEELLINTSDLQKKLPVAELADQFVLLLEKVEVASGSRITSIAFNRGENVEANVNTTPEQNLQQYVEDKKQATDQNQALLQGNTADTQKQKVSLPEGIKGLTATMTVEAPSYVELAAFIKELEELPRITKVENLSFSGVKEGATSNVLTYTVVATTYYYPELAELKSQLPKYETPAPSKKANPLYEAEEIQVEKQDVKEIQGEKQVPNVKEVQKEKQDVKEVQKDKEVSKDKLDDSKIVKKNGKQYKITSYKVQPGDTLFELAVKYYNNNKGQELIKSWNDIEDIQAGLTIEIPIPVDGEI